MNICGQAAKVQLNSYLELTQEVWSNKGCFKSMGTLRQWSGFDRDTTVEKRWIWLRKRTSPQPLVSLGFSCRSSLSPSFLAACIVTWCSFLKVTVGSYFSYLLLVLESFQKFDMWSVSIEFQRLIFYFLHYSLSLCGIVKAMTASQIFVVVYNF